MAEQIKMLFGMNTPGGYVGSDPPTERGGGPVLNFGTSLISGIAEARELKFV